MEFGRVDESNEDANKDNEWHKQMKEFLLGGAIPKGRPAVRNRGQRNWGTHVSVKQRKALRR